MKRTQHTIVHGMLGAVMAVALAFAGCTKNFEDLNKNPYGVSEEELKWDYQYIGEPFKQIQRSIYVSNPTWVFQIQQNLMGDLFAGYMTPPNPFGNLNNNNNTYNLQDGWNVVLWGCAYGSYTPSSDNSVMPVCKYLAELTEKESPHFYAWMKILKVLTMHRIADAYGPIIYTKYGQLNADGSVDYDSQKDAYYAFFADLDQAITILTKYMDDGAAPAFTKFDLSPYAGDYKKWLQLANSLRLRLAIRVSKVDPQKAKQEGEAALKHKAGLLEAHADNLTIDIAPMEHPMSSISEGWQDARMAAPMESILTGLNDPRLTRYFKESVDYPGQFKGIRQGVDMPEKSRYVNFSRLNNDGDLFAGKRVQLMTAAEVWFLRAEAAMRNWDGAGTAQANYEKGIEVSFAQHGTSGGFATYRDDAVSKPAAYTDPKNAANNIAAGNPNLSTITVKWDDAATDARKLERIITQKWIAVFPDGQEAWAEFRRTGYPKLFPVMINNSGGKISTTDFVRRVNFVQTEYETNPAGVQKAMTLLGGPDNGGTRVWWDKP